jgi:hypothetical protein
MLVIVTAVSTTVVVVIQTTRWILQGWYLQGLRQKAIAAVPGVRFTMLMFLLLFGRYVVVSFAVVIHWRSLEEALEEASGMEWNGMEWNVAIE